MKDAHNPFCIPYIVWSKARRVLEQLWPGLWLTQRMSRRLRQKELRDECIRKRFQEFAEQVPFANVDFDSMIGPPQRDQLFGLADAVLAHRFDLLGSGSVDLGEEIDWHRDFVTGFRWDPSAVYSRIQTMASPGTDIKRPWELSRCQHFVAMGLAGQLSGDPRYCNGYIDQTENWIKQNPVGFGVNWACPMDVAIRAVNWLAGYALFYPLLSTERRPEFDRKITKSLWEHARFIETHLEWNGPFSKRRANHFLSDITGLFTLGFFFKDTPQGRRWLRFSHKYLEVEIKRQVFDDGVHFECSTAYHRLCLEMFLWCRRLGENAGISFSKEYGQRLLAMQKFSAAYTRPDGQAPLIGDNDDGRLLYSGLYEIDDHRYLYSESVSLNVDQALIAGKNMPTVIPESGSQFFQTAGFYVFKEENVYLMVRAGRLAVNGAHAHNDQLSFELCIGDEPLFVDRGSYVYTSNPGQRNRYRSTAAHNVMQINGAEQNPVLNQLFLMPDETQAAAAWTGTSLEAIHRGFRSLNRPVAEYQRRFELQKGGLTITDCASVLLAGDTIDWFFHLAPRLTTEFLETKIIVHNKHNSVCTLEYPNDLEVRMERFDHSPSYGRLQPADVLVFSRRINTDVKNFSWQYKILWGK